jgi:hydroxymethylpyrimidine/phosphomethylpyrimidine kinase
MRLVAIGGFDPSGGAGVVRDFLTARALGAAARLIATAWTEQSPTAVHAVEAREAGNLERAIQGALDELRPSAAKADPGTDGEARLAVKIGMLPDPRAANAVRASLRDFTGPVVLDPVLWASSGGALFSGDPLLLLPLCARATLVTPNAGEAAALTGIPVRSLADAVDAGRALCLRGARAVLVKGGHIESGRLSVDVLVTPGEVQELSADRVPGPPVRGTGCALATAIALGLGQGLPLAAAVADAKAWLSTALAGAIPVGREWHLS